MTQTQKDLDRSELPMVVHLRGDEEWVDQFTVEADEAMAFLGIKRSRLAQISGRELRVGRIRKDRYIRPVYRREDLDRYHRWTRATATHKSSSETIRDSLDEAIEAWSKSFAEILAEHKDNILPAFRSVLELMRRQVLEVVDKRHHEHGLKVETLMLRQAQIKEVLLAELPMIAGLRDEIAVTRSLNKSLNEEVRDLKASVQILRNEIETEKLSHRSELQELFHCLESLKQREDNSLIAMERVEAALENLKDSVASDTTKNRKPRRLLRHRFVKRRERSQLISKL